MAVTIIEDPLAAWLAALPDVAARAGGRVYPWRAIPQNTAWPFLAYHRVHGRRIRGLRGPVPVGVSAVRLQIDVWALTYAEAREIGASVRESLDALSGGVLGTRWVQCSIAEEDADDPDDERGVVSPPFGDEVTQHRVTIDLLLWFTEI